MAQEQIGATVETGPSDWQIVQQDERGSAAIMLGGRWRVEEQAGAPGAVQVRVVREDTGAPVTRDLDWRTAETAADGTWSTALDVPAGGLYRLETRYTPPGTIAAEWSPRGDMRHFWGVGDLWVIAGQSNSAGYGRGEIYDPPTLGVHLLRNSEEWALAAHPLNDSTATRHPANREAGNPGHSPYIEWGRIVQREMGFPIGLVQTALGGSPLTDWNPAEPGPAPLFDNMVHCVRRAGGQVRGILWYQGESETGTDETAGSYVERFCGAVDAWRRAFAAPRLPVITVQLNRVYQERSAEADRRWSLVREAQRRVPDAIENVLVVPALDLPLSDLIHTSPAGNLTLGVRMARAALGGVYGRPVNFQAPNIQTARLREPTTLVLSFAGVSSRIDSIDPFANPFRVDDTAGEIPVEAITYPGDATVVLRLGRAPEGNALVHGGYGAAPAIVPMDAERWLPMLAFSQGVVA